MKTSSAKHGKTKSGIPLEEVPYLTGWLARESTLVDRLLNKRYGALYPTTFATYRKESDDSPSKVWPINQGVSVTAVKEDEYHVRHAHTSTLWAVARGAYDKCRMWSFTITWSGLVTGTEKLTIAFETTAQANEWHDAFSEVIKKAAHRPPRTVSMASESSVSTVEGGDSAVSSVQPTRGISSFQPNESSAPPPPSGKRRTRAWASVLHINGISVYVEEQDEEGEGGAVMVSAVVRAPPVDVFKSLVQVRKTEGLGIFAGARTVEVVDHATQVIAQSWIGSGLVAGMCCAPREMCCLRTWRKDEDGTYIVLYQSANHATVPRSSAWSMKAPVRVHVQAAGFTISPLLPQYTTSGESQEALVTLVLKADLGGTLSGSSLASRLVSPLVGHATRGMLEPVVTSIIVLRDRVEQNRFVVRPLSIAADEREARRETREQAGPGRGLNRASTLLLYRGRLEEAQKQAAEGRVTAESLVLDATPPVSRLAPAAAAPRASEHEGEPADEKAVPSKDMDEDETWAITGTCRKEFWSSPGSLGFKVRGSSYLVDKTKIPAAPPMFELVAVDLLELEEPMMHICRYLPSVRQSPAPFLFCVQMMVPSSPHVSLVITWAAPMPLMNADPEALIKDFEKDQGFCPENVSSFFRVFTDFLNGDGPEADMVRNSRFKLIPSISKGSWIIKQSVGTTPVILGQKLSTKYFRGERYFEIDVDIGANSVAASITNLVCGATKSLALDMAVLLEGKSNEHLPEQLIGTIRLDKLDLKTAAYFDEATFKVLRPEGPLA